MYLLKTYSRSQSMFKEKLKQIPFIRNTFVLLMSFRSFFNIKPFLFIKQYVWFFSTLKKLGSLDKNPNFKNIEYYPCLFDNLSYTPLEPTYFFQDSWAAKHIFDLKPKHHYDIGSSAKTMGILSQFVPITIVDIRPIELKLPNLYFQKGSILELPFKDNSLEIISSLCVVEHIGLGRYGDSIDPFGSEKSIKELQRVVKVEGIILFSVPVDSENKVYFNAHRAFTRDYVLHLFDNFTLMDEQYHYGTKMFDKYDKSKGFGTGLYMFKKDK